MKNSLNKRVGFTVIEVTLVLAIAGLIFMMIFVALPALQRSQRDGARRDDMATFISEVKRYVSSNRGALPGTGAEDSPLPVVWETDVDGKNPAKHTWAAFYGGYLGERFVDPDGEHYRLKIVSCNKDIADADCEGSYVDDVSASSFPYDNYSLLVVLQGKCAGETVKSSVNPKDLAVLYRLEGAGTYCIGT